MIYRLRPYLKDGIPAFGKSLDSGEPVLELFGGELAFFLPFLGLLGRKFGHFGLRAQIVLKGFCTAVVLHCES